MKSIQSPKRDSCSNLCVLLGARGDYCMCVWEEEEEEEEEEGEAEIESENELCGVGGGGQTGETCNYNMTLGFSLNPPSLGHPLHICQRLTAGNLGDTIPWTGFGAQWRTKSLWRTSLPRRTSSGSAVRLTTPPSPPQAAAAQSPRAQSPRAPRRAACAPRSATRTRAAAGWERTGESRHSHCAPHTARPNVGSAHLRPSKMCQCDASGSKPSPGSLAEAGKLFLKHTTLHGLRHIFLSGSYPRRVAWLLAFLAALALLFTWSSNRVRYLLSSPVYTKAHMVYAKRLVFPAVTICNQNLLLPRRMKKTDIFSAGRWLGLLGRNWQVSPAAREALTPLGGHDGGSAAPDEPSWSPLSRILDFNHFLPPPRESQPSMRQLLDRLGHQLEEMLLYCRYQGEMCGPRNFSTVSVAKVPCSICAPPPPNRLMQLSEVDAAFAWGRVAGWTVCNCLSVSFKRRVDRHQVAVQSICSEANAISRLCTRLWPCCWLCASLVQLTLSHSSEAAAM